MELMCRKESHGWSLPTQCSKWLRTRTCDPVWGHLIWPCRVICLGSWEKEWNQGIALLYPCLGGRNVLGCSRYRHSCGAFACGVPLDTQTNLVAPGC